MALRTLSTLGPLAGKRVIVRADLNVPLQDAVITDDGRVRATLPTLNALINQGARVIVCSHLGRPDGAPDPKYSLEPVAQRLSELLGKPVAFARDTVGESAREAVAALDVSIQAQILNLFMDLREQLKLTYVFISHDLGVVEHLSDRVVIMYLGRVVESAPVEEVFRRPNHPYTQALLAEIPRIDVRHKTFSAIRGEIPSPIAPPGGCHFHPRCPHAMPRCRTEVPTLRGVAINHVSACHLNDT